MNEVQKRWIGKLEFFILWFGLIFNVDEPFINIFANLSTFARSIKIFSQEHASNTVCYSALSDMNVEKVFERLPTLQLCPISVHQSRQKRQECRIFTFENLNHLLRSITGSLGRRWHWLVWLFFFMFWCSDADTAEAGLWRHVGREGQAGCWVSAGMYKQTAALCLV